MPMAIGIGIGLPFGGSAAGGVASPPVNSVAPVVSGSTPVGSTLSTTNGTWSNTPTGYTYQWTADGTNIGGATSGTYVTVSGDLGKAIGCKVTASNAAGSATQASSNTITVTAALIAATYLPATTPVGSFAPYIVWGARRLMSGYTGNMFRLTNSGKTATLDVPALTQNNADQNSQLPDYSAITTWIAANCGGATTAFVDTFYDQSGAGATGTRNATQATVANMPIFDPSQLLNGCSPIIFDGQSAAGAVILKRKYMTYTDATGYDRQATTIIDALDPVSSLDANVYWSIGGNVQMFSNSDQTPLPVSHSNVSSSAFGSPSIQGKMLRSQPQVTGVVFGASDVRQLTQDVIQGNGSTPFPGTSSGSTPLTLSDSTPFGGGSGGGGQAKRWAFVLYNAALGDPDLTTIHDRLVTINAIPTVFTSTHVFGDDSIPYGYLTDNLQPKHEQFLAANAITGTPQIFSVGIPGQTLVQAAARFATLSPILKLSAGGNNFLWMQGKINDFLGASTDISVLQTLITYTTTAKDAGWTVGWDVGTPVAASNTTAVKTQLFNMAQWMATRGSVAGNFGATGLFTAQPGLPYTSPDLVALCYFDATLGGGTLAAATTQNTAVTPSIYVDGVHLSPAGQLVEAQVYAPVINAGLAAVATPAFASYGGSVFVNTTSGTLTAASLAALGTITANDLLVFHLVNGNTNVFTPAGNLVLGGAVNGEVAMATIQNAGGTTEQFYWKQPTAAEASAGTFSCTFLAGTGAGLGGFYVHLIRNASRVSVTQFVQSGAGSLTLDFTGFVPSNISKGTLIVYDVDVALSPGTPPTGFSVLASTNGTVTRTYAIAGRFGGYVSGTALSVTALPAAVKRGFLLDVI